MIIRETRLAPGLPHAVFLSGKFFVMAERGLLEVRSLVTSIGSDCDQLTGFNQLEAAFVDLPKGFAACQFKTDSAEALAVSLGGLLGLEILEAYRRK